MIRIDVEEDYRHSAGVMRIQSKLAFLERVLFLGFGSQGFFRHGYSAPQELQLNPKNC